MKTKQSQAEGITPRIETEASEWFLRIRSGGLSEQELNAWRRWLEKDSACERAFREVEALWCDLDTLDDIPLLDDLALEADHYQGDEPVSFWLEESQESQETRQRQENQKRQTWGHPVSAAKAPGIQRLLSGLSYPRMVWPSMMAASLAVAALVFVVMPEAPGPKTKLESYQTAHAQHRSITLRDGSQIDLGAETILTVSFSDSAREVNLVRGEAYFQVAPNKSRPFTVQMGKAFVQVVGTAFNIDRDGRGGTVTVLEGHVRVAEKRQHLLPGEGELLAEMNYTELLAGDQVVVDNGGAPGEVNKVDADASIAWREGLLVFVGQPMGDVIDELNRYSERRIILANASVGAITFTGTVDKTRIDEWLDSLGKAYPINVSVIDAQTVLLFEKGL